MNKDKENNIQCKNNYYRLKSLLKHTIILSKYLKLFVPENTFDKETKLNEIKYKYLKFTQNEMK